VRGNYGTPQRERLLRLLVRKDGTLPLSKAAKLLKTSVQSLSPIVSRLEDAGFVIKSQSAIDPRMKDVSITRQGRKFLDSV
jgi:DNA-binding MarR family transcriptional regulator